MTRTAAALALLAACAHPTPAAGGADRQGPWSVRLVDEAGRTLPSYQLDGRTYVLGTLGRRYAVVVRNRSARRVEVVVSVDGRDVVDGQPASTARRGYLVDPRGEVTVDGFRVSDESVAAFRFSSVPRSYAARMGDARDVGVIGVAVYPEAAPPPPLVRPQPHPWSEEDEAGASRDSSASGRAPAPPEAKASAEAQAGDGARLRAGQRRGLGTEFGEERDSAVTHVAFERASSTPAAVLSLRYDDRSGLVALGIDVEGRRDDAWLRATAEPFRGYAQPPPGWR